MHFARNICGGALRKAHAISGDMEAEAAKRTQVVLIDDIDGKELDGDAKSLTFSVAGVDYSIDLSEKNKEKFDKALEPYIHAARKVGGRRSRPSTSTDKAQLASIRSWAKSQGLKVSDRGRVSREVREAYDKAH